MFELDIAKKHISSDPRMVLFTVLAVALAIGVIVVMMGINEGYKSDLVNSLVENNPHLIVSPKENEDYITLYRTLSRIIHSYPQVEAVSPASWEKRVPSIKIWSVVQALLEQILKRKIFSRMYKRT